MRLYARGGGENLARSQQQYSQFSQRSIITKHLAGYKYQTEGTEKLLSKPPLFYFFFLQGFTLLFVQLLFFF